MLSNTSAHITYTGNSLATTFDWNFYIPDSDSIEVILYNPSTFTEVELAYGVDYSATGFGLDAGGTVTYPLSGSPLSSSYTISIRRKEVFTQTLDLTALTNNNPVALEAALDRIVRFVQQVDANTSVGLLASDLTLEELTATLNDYAGLNDAMLAATAATFVDADILIARRNTDGAVIRMTWSGIKTLLSALYFAKTGGTLTGDVTINKVNPQLYLQKTASGEASNIWGMTGATARWLLSLGTTSAESGGNAGSNMAIVAYDDAGTLIDTPLSIARVAGGALAISRPVTMASTLALTGALTLTAGQIAFPATQNASADANTLDDYEEGSFTPAMTFNGSTSGIVYSAQSGTYVKVGKLVFFAFTLTLTNNGSGVGNAKFTGLPFTNSGFPSPCALHLVAGGSAATGLYGMVDASGTAITIYVPGAGSATNATDTNCTNTFDVRVSGVYQATA